MTEADPAVLDVDLVVVGGSAGSLDVLMELLPALSTRCPPVAVVLHMPAHVPSRLVAVFRPRCAVPVQEVEDKTPATPGTVTFARPDYHLLIERGPAYALSLDERIQHARPSIDVLFETAAWAVGTRLLAVLLSGANADGADGLAQVRAGGGRTWVQDPETAAYPAMPRAALERAPHPTVGPAELVAAFRALTHVDRSRRPHP